MLFCYRYVCIFLAADKQFEGDGTVAVPDKSFENRVGSKESLQHCDPRGVVDSTLKSRSVCCEVFDPYLHFH